MSGALIFPGFTTHAPGKALFSAGSLKRGVSLLPGHRVLDMRFGGVYVVRGTTAIAGAPDVPVARRVRLYHRERAAFMAKEVWSSQDGSYEFRSVARGPWFVTAHDHTGEYNAVIADNIVGEPM